MIEMDIISRGFFTLQFLSEVTNMPMKKVKLQKVRKGIIGRIREKVFRIYIIHRFKLCEYV